MTQGRNGELRRESVVESKLFVAGEIEERELRGDVTVLLSLVTAVDLSWLKKTFPDDFSDRSKTYYDPIHDGYTVAVNYVFETSH